MLIANNKRCAKDISIVLDRFFEAGISGRKKRPSTHDFAEFRLMALQDCSKGVIPLKRHSFSIAYPRQNQRERR
jgi:hypothetical protein